MSRCKTCGNEYDKAFTVKWHDGREHTFDSFECAVHALAPACDHCGCKIIGHGMEADGKYYCCAHCGSKAGIRAFEDRVS